MHAYIHTYMGGWMHACTHTNKHAYMHACMYTLVLFYLDMNGYSHEKYVDLLSKYDAFKVNEDSTFQPEDINDVEQTEFEKVEYIVQPDTSFNDKHVINKNLTGNVF